MPDEQYPPNEAISQSEADAEFLTPTEGNAAYVQRSGITKFFVGTSAAGAVVNDTWVDTN